MKAYPTYKQIGLPWMPQIPSGWDVQRNKNFLIEQKEEVGSRGDDYLLLSLTKQGVIVRDTSEGKGKFPKDFEKYKVVHPDDIIFCLFDVDETPRTVGVSPFAGMITGAYDIFKVEGISERFLLYYYLNVDNQKALKPFYSGLRKVVKLPTFLALPLPVPSKGEQEAIVKYLDWKISKINSYVAERERVTRAN